MKPNKKKNEFSSNCQIPRRESAVLAILGLAWMKPKKDRPDWLLSEIKGISD